MSHVASQEEAGQLIAPNEIRGNNDAFVRGRVMMPDVALAAMFQRDEDEMEENGASCMQHRAMMDEIVNRNGKMAPKRGDGAIVGGVL